MDNISILVIINTVALWVSVFAFISVKRQENKLMEKKINIQTTVDVEVIGILDMMIAEMFNEYVTLNIEHRSDIYLTAETEEEILRGVAELVEARISDTMMLKLSSYYDLSALPDVISNKICVMVTAYAIDRNDIKEDRDDL